MSTPPEVIKSFCKLLDNTMDVNTLHTFQQLIDDRIEVVTSGSETENEISFGGVKSRMKQSKSCNSNLNPRNKPEVQNNLTNDLIKYNPNFLNDNVQLQRTKDELDTFYNEKQLKKYLWLSTTQEPYKFGGLTCPAIDITGFQNIMYIMDLLNEKLDLKLDCCLVSLYKSVQSKVNLHSDNEDIIDQNHSICNISIGSNRVIEFQDIVTSDIVASIKMEHGSLVSMAPGTQQKLQHQVLPQDDLVKANVTDKVRYCLSFRKLANTNSASVVVPEKLSVPPPLNNIKLFDDSALSDNTHKDIPPITNLIIGDSLTRDIAPNINTLTLTKGGAKMKDILPLLDSNVDKLPPPSYNNIKSVILCVGTNSLSNLSGPLLGTLSDYDKLVRELIALFPKATIGLFNVPPRYYKSVILLRRIVAFNNFLADLPNVYRQVRSIPLYWEFITDRGYLNPRWYNEKDFLHFSKDGKLMVTNCFGYFQDSLNYKR